MSTPPPACTVGCDAVVPATAEAGVAVGLRALAVPKGCVGEPSFAWDFGDGSAPGAGESVTHTWPAGTFTWKVTVTAGTGSCSRSGTIAVSGGGGGGESWVAVVPAVSHAPGDKGSLWRTDLAVVNHGAAAANVAGAARIASDVPLCVASRTFNQDETGTFGGFLPAVTAGEALAPGRAGILPHLARNALFRTNVGVTNLGAAPVSATIRLFAESGAAAGAPIPVTVPPGGLHQVVDPFGVAGAGDRDVAFATVEVTTPGGLAWAYASVIDNATSDPTIVPVIVP